jgi:hypothetical protein
VVQIDPAHSRHVDVRNHARGAAQMRRTQEVLCGRKCLGCKSCRPHETPDGLANRLVIVDDRNHWLLILHYQLGTRRHARRCDPVLRAGMNHPPDIRGIHARRDYTNV